MGYPVYMKGEESPFRVNVCGWAFVFSSEYNQERFQNQFVSYVEYNAARFRVRYKVEPELEMVFAYTLYLKIEKRINYIVRPDGEVLQWPKVTGKLS